MKRIEFVLTVFLLTTITHILSAQGIWSSVSDFGGGNSSMGAATAALNKGYAIKGGTTQFWEYNPLTDTWTQKANIGGDIRNDPVCFTINDKIYAGLGNGFTELNDFWMYDPLTNVWTQKAGFGATDSTGSPIGGRAIAVGFALNGKGYVGGGLNSGYAFKDFYEYDPIMNSWTQKNDLPGPVRYGAVSFTIGNKAYIATGGDAMGTFYNDLWEYDQPTDTWTQKANYPGTPMHRAIAFSIGNKAYLGNGHNFTSDFWSWDQSTNTWSPISPFPGTPRYRSIAFTIGNEAFVGTGTITGSTTDDMWKYDPSCNVPAPHICMVSTDSATNYKYNIIYWDESLYPNVDSFYVYRKDALSSNYLQIGSLPANSPGVFIDTLSQIGGPNAGSPLYSSWFYKIAIRDTCGILSEKSPYHQTMFVQQNFSNFTWNAYTIESGQTNPVLGYALLRDNDNTGNWQIIVTPSGLLATDPLFSNYPNGNWRIDALGFSCSSSAKNKLLNTASRSNTIKLVTVSSDDYMGKNIDFSIYPNPVNEKIEIFLKESCTIFIYDMTQKLILSAKLNMGQNSLSLADLKNGLYCIKAVGINSTGLQKFVILK
ncbi:MAG: N-acetylneuraminate epimerase [Bacteroidetes bacterium ADurb.Bin408]|nr:MAG: N-acetylneuraminate epimerase [Bacteroidetes bacterium ADurb.Bin408]